MLTSIYISAIVGNTPFGKAKVVAISIQSDYIRIGTEDACPALASAVTKRTDTNPIELIDGTWYYTLDR